MSRRTRVGLSELAVDCVIGANPEEREGEQRVYVSFEVRYRRPPEADERAAAVDYSVAAERLRRVAVEGRFVLLESLAGALADELARDERIDAVRVECRKPAARADASHAYAVVEWEGE